MVLVAFLFTFVGNNMSAVTMNESYLVWIYCVKPIGQGRTVFLTRYNQIALGRILARCIRPLYDIAIQRRFRTFSGYPIGVVMLQDVSSMPRHDDALERDGEKTSKASR
jgi:hypothetical protein